MIKRVIIGVVLFGGVVGVTIAGVRPRGPKPVYVQLARASRESITRTITAAGKLESATTVKINSNVSGDLVALGVKVGDRVKRGQVLARVEPTRYRAQAKSAQAALSAAEADVVVLRVMLEHDQKELQRIIGLQAKGVSSEAELEKQRSIVATDDAKLSAAQQRADQARAHLEEAADYVQKCTLSSPIDGEIIELGRELGERVRGSDLSEDVIMVLAALSQMEVKVEVGEHEVVYLEVGDRAEVELDAIEGRRFPGQLIEIGQNAIVRNRGTEAEVTTFPIRVALESRPPGALPGMSATVHVATETHEQAIVLPIQAVTVRPDMIQPAQKAYGGKGELVKVVFVVKDGKVELRRVRVGLSSENSIEVTDGIGEGEQVVSGPYRTIAKELKDGDLVQEQGEMQGPMRSSS